MSHRENDISSTGPGLVSQGLKACQGCGLELAGRVLIESLGPDSVMAVAPGCGANFSGQGPVTPLRIPGLLTTLADPAAFASGIKAGFEAQGRANINVVVLAGDGATADIGLASLSGALERGERIIYVCYDNESYASCGFQTGSSTPRFARTSTTPDGNPVRRKNLMQIVAAHDLPYAASASVGDIDDFKRKIGRALAASRHGPAFLHVHTPCPLAWGCDSSKTVEMARKAIRAKCWVLYEVFDGEQVVLSSLAEPISVADYLRPQRRFGAITPDQLAEAQKMVDRLYAVLADRAGNSAGPAADWSAAAAS